MMVGSSTNARNARRKSISADSLAACSGMKRGDDSISSRSCETLTFASTMIKSMTSAFITVMSSRLLPHEELSIPCVFSDCADASDCGGRQRSKKKVTAPCAARN